MIKSVNGLDFLKRPTGRSSRLATSALRADFTRGLALR